MLGLEIFFWLAFGCVAYTYLVYPLLLGVLARLRPRPVQRGPFTGSLSVVLAVHNEEKNLGRRLEELQRLTAATDRPAEILVVSDGSTDRTAEIARGFPGVRVVELAENQGKAVALTQGCQAAGNDILVFCDVRQTWAPEALGLLLENFADPRVGAVSGDLMIETAPGVLAGVGLYWRFEKWLRNCEGRVHSTVGVTGAISAVRRSLFPGIPAGTLIDDVYWPLCVARQGFRVVHDERAKGYDRLPDRSRDEFRRKVRTLAGNFQLLTRLPTSLVPWKNPICWQFLSHKVLRLVVPWALLGLLVSSALLPGEFFRWFFLAQVVGYALGLLGLWPAVGKRLKPAAAAGSFLVLNAAAWLAFWVWISGRASKTWHKVAYSKEAGTPLLPISSQQVGTASPG